MRSELAPHTPSANACLNHRRQIRADHLDEVGPALRRSQWLQRHHSDCAAILVPQPEAPVAPGYEPVASSPLQIWRPVEARLPAHPAILALQHCRRLRSGVRMRPLQAWGSTQLDCSAICSSTARPPGTSLAESLRCGCGLHRASLARAPVKCVGDDGREAEAKVVRRAKKFLGAGARFATSISSQKMPLLREGWLHFSRSRPLSLGIVDQAPHAARNELRAGAWGANSLSPPPIYSQNEPRSA